MRLLGLRSRIKHPMRQRGVRFHRKHAPAAKCLPLSREPKGERYRPNIWRNSHPNRVPRGKRNWPSAERSRLLSGSHVCCRGARRRAEAEHHVIQRPSPNGPLAGHGLVLANCRQRFTVCETLADQVPQLGRTNDLASAYGTHRDTGAGFYHRWPGVARRGLTAPTGRRPRLRGREPARRPCPSGEWPPG